ncbi:MAG: 2-hydroxyglutaryl-CoA dehydratase [Chloroflexi bacterium]|nr:2-hydroxyglutaryl-CoA dehydratase [Chloroflexota bacterium]
MNDRDILSHAVVPTRVSSERSGRMALEQALEKANLRSDDVRFTVATGYGRIVAPFANGTTTEITCHAMGAYYLNPKVRTVLDIGGQDCKAIRVGERGQVVNFVLNDKCAAGTGRFLEVVAKVFEVEVAELGQLCNTATERVPVSSTCTIFAESECISLMARGEKPENIVAGVHYSVGRRVAGLLSRVGVESELAFTGGVGKNVGMQSVVGELLGIAPIGLPGDPQLVGAIGAAIIAKGRAARG